MLISIIFFILSGFGIFFLFRRYLSVFSCVNLLIFSIFITTILKKHDNKQKYIYDSSFSIFLKKESSYSYSITKEKSLAEHFTFVKIQKPLFFDVLRNQTLDEKGHVIEKINGINTTILLESENIELAIMALDLLKDYNVKEMKLIENRYWEVVIQYYNKKIRISFPQGNPDVTLIKTNIHLLQVYKDIDFRFLNKIAVS